MAHRSAPALCTGGVYDNSCITSYYCENSGLAAALDGQHNMVTVFCNWLVYSNNDADQKAALCLGVGYGLAIAGYYWTPAEVGRAILLLFGVSTTTFCS